MNQGFRSLTGSLSGQGCRSIALVLILVCCSVAELGAGAQSAADPAIKAGSDTPQRFDAQIAGVLKEGKEMDCPPFLAKPLGLANSRGHWFCKYEAVEKDLDKSSHIFLVSVDGKNDVAIVFKAGDDSYSINWRTDASGRLVLTVYASASEAHIVPNSEYSERFEAEEAIWDKLGKRASPTPTAN